jgi:hypothetical protein
MLPKNHWFDDILNRSFAVWDRICFSPALSVSLAMLYVPLKVVTGVQY